MPELPEAEANRLRVERECLNRTIESAEPGRNASYIELPGANERRRLVGHRFTLTRRHGKLIFAGSKSGPWICVHLGMSGSLHAFDANEADPPTGTMFLIGFEGERRLAFRCPRKLGWLRVIDDPDAEIARIGFGPDALAIGKAEFVERIGGTRGAVKSALIDQHKIAGVGNLWSDEILYQTGVLPGRMACELDRRKLGEMHAAMQRLLKAAVAAGADYAKLPRDWLVRNRTHKAACAKCGGTITHRTVGGRTAYFCPQHQA